jgi:hypothetical protein
MSNTVNVDLITLQKMIAETFDIKIAGLAEQLKDALAEKITSLIMLQTSVSSVAGIQKSIKGSNYNGKMIESININMTRIKTSKDFIAHIVKNGTTDTSAGAIFYNSIISSLNLGKDDEDKLLQQLETVQTTTKTKNAHRVAKFNYLYDFLLSKNADFNKEFDLIYSQYKSNIADNIYIVPSTFFIGCNSKMMEQLEAGKQNGAAYDKSADSFSAPSPGYEDDEENALGLPPINKGMIDKIDNIDNIAPMARPVPASMAMPQMNTMATHAPMAMPQMNTMATPAPMAMPQMNTMATPAPMAMPQMNTMSTPAPMSMAMPQMNTMSTPAPMAMPAPQMNTMSTPAPMSMAMPAPQMNTMSTPAPMAMPQMNTMATPAPMAMPQMNTMATPAPMAMPAPQMNTMSTPAPMAMPQMNTMSTPAPMAMPQMNTMSTPAPMAMPAPQMTPMSTPAPMSIPAPQMNIPAPMAMPQMNTMATPAPMATPQMAPMTMPQMTPMAMPQAPVGINIPQYNVSPSIDALKKAAAEQGIIDKR